MKLALATAIIGVSALTGGMLSAPADMMKNHANVAPEASEWMPGSDIIPSALEAVVLSGDPSKDGWFALKLELPADYTIPPHSHSHPEIVMVRSGTLYIGTGKRIDHDQARALPAGSFYAFPPDATHFAFTEEETVIQLNSTGPWALGYSKSVHNPES